MNIDDNVIKHVDTYKYLGHEINFGKDNETHEIYVWPGLDLEDEGK